MRLLTTFSNPDEVKTISQFLTSQGIENKVDGEKDTDWGSSDFGSHTFKLWIIDEDQTDTAVAFLREFEKDPKNPLYNQIPKIVTLPRTQTARKNSTKQNSITTYLIAICSLIYAWTAFTSPQLEGKNSSPLFTSPIKQKMLFDFPKSYEILDKLVTKYGMEALKNPQTLPQEGKTLMTAYNSTPSWQGVYEEMLTYLTTGEFLPKAPWFEKIKEGEVWRLFSPIFLHGDIFHILFNMAWLYVLGKQLEVQLKPARYIIFILIAAAFSNTAQYLISGPNFLGFSGVICAMLAYIWQRQKDAPWEGYQIQKSTFNFMMIFIFGMVALQSLAFLAEVGTGKTVTTSIANGAHVAGLALGYVLSKIPFFTEKKN